MSDTHTGYLKRDKASIVVPVILVCVKFYNPDDPNSVKWESSIPKNSLKALVDLYKPIRAAGVDINIRTLTTTIFHLLCSLGVDRLTAKTSNNKKAGEYRGCAWSSIGSAFLSIAPAPKKATKRPRVEKAKELFWILELPSRLLVPLCSHVFLFSLYRSWFSVFVPAIIPDGVKCSSFVSLKGTQCFPCLISLFICYR